MKELLQSVRSVQVGDEEREELIQNVRLVAIADRVDVDLVSDVREGDVSVKRIDLGQHQHQHQHRSTASVAGISPSIRDSGDSEEDGNERGPSRGCGRCSAVSLAG